MLGARKSSAGKGGPWDDGPVMGIRVARAAGTLVVGVAVALGILTALHAGLAGLDGFDREVQAWVHGWPRGLLGLMMAMTALGEVATFVPAVAFVAIGMMVKGDRRWAATLGLALVGAIALNEGLKMHFHRMRPGVAWTVGHEKTYSFPSGHALFAATLYGSLLWLGWRGATAGRRCGLVAVAGALVLGIGVSRVYLGAHWPTDVLAGYAVGVVWVATVMVVEQVWTMSGRRQE